MSQTLSDAGFRAVNDFARATPWLHTSMVDYAKYGVALFAALLLVNWWLARAHGAASVATSLWAPVGALVALGLNQPVGNLFHEPRPYAVLPHVFLLVDRTSDFSFPSDHAVMAGAVTAGILTTDRRLGLLTAAAAVLMAFARVYVGAHFPLDVGAGLVFGAMVSVVIGLLVRPLLTGLVEGLGRTRLSPLVFSRRPHISA